MSNKITYYWDDSTANEGWYVEIVSPDGETIIDSAKVWFPIDVDQYCRDEGDQLASDLRVAYPDAVV